MASIRPALLRTWRIVIRFGPPLVLISAAVTYWSAERARAEGSRDEPALAAERAAAAVDLYLARTVNDLMLITNAPDVRALAVEKSDDRTRDENHEKLLEQEWGVKEEDKFGLEKEIGAILDNDLSKYLQSIVRQNGMVIREVAITDRFGRLFAASVRTDDYFQGDDSWWPENPVGFLDCRNAPIACARFPGSLRWDLTASSWGLDVVLPIFAPGDSAIVGILKAVIDPLQDLNPLTASALDVRLLNKQDGKELLPRGTPLILSDNDKNNLTTLERGRQFLTQDGRIRIRALSGPLGQHWAVAAGGAVELQRASWIMPGAWLALTIAALFLCSASRPAFNAVAPSAAAPEEAL